MLKQNIDRSDYIFFILIYLLLLGAILELKGSITYKTHRVFVEVISLKSTLK